MSDSPLVELRGLGRSFGAVRALEGVDLTVRHGEAIGLIGRNGTGKSTLIRVLAGLIRATSGNARVLDADAWDGSDASRQRIGYMSQTQSMYGWMRIGHALELCARMNPRWDGAYADELVRRLELPLERRVRGLSLGMRRRVGLACALAVRPELLLLDEPLAGLDAVVRAAVLDAVVELLREQRTATIFASHILSDVERIATRVVLLDGGRVRFDGAPQGLRKLAPQPERKCSASFEGVSAEEVERAVHARHPEARIVVHPPSLEELFVEHVGAEPDAKVGK